MPQIIEIFQAHSYTEGVTHHDDEIRRLGLVFSTLTTISLNKSKFTFSGIITATGILVVAVLPHDKDFNIDFYYAQGPEGEDFRHKAFVNPLYVEAMLQLKPFLYNKGLL